MKLSARNLLKGRLGGRGRQVAQRLPRREVSRRLDHFDESEFHRCIYRRDKIVSAITKPGIEIASEYAPRAGNFQALDSSRNFGRDPSITGAFAFPCNV